MISLVGSAVAGAGMVASLFAFATPLTLLKLSLLTVGLAPTAAAVVSFRKVRRKVAALIAARDVVGRRAA
jgi:hypothetical protein